MKDLENNNKYTKFKSIQEKLNKVYSSNHHKNDNIKIDINDISEYYNNKKRDRLVESVSSDALVKSELNVIIKQNNNCTENITSETNSNQTNIDNSINLLDASAYTKNDKHNKEDIILNCVDNSNNPEVIFQNDMFIVNEENIKLLIDKQTQTNASDNIVIDDNTSISSDVIANIIVEDISINGTIYHSNKFYPDLINCYCNKGLSQILNNNNNANQSINMCKHSIIGTSNIEYMNGSYIKTNDMNLDIFTNNNLKIKTNQKIIVDTSNMGIGNIEPTEMLDVSGNIRLNKDIIFLVNDVNNILSFNDFISTNQLSALPSINHQPVSLTRISILNNTTYNKPLIGDKEMLLNLNNDILVNQLNLGFNGSVITTSNDMNAQYLEIYSNIEILPISNKTTLSLDISGVGNNLYEIIDTKYLEKNGTFYLTFGPHLFTPNQMTSCSDYVLKLKNHTSNIVTVKKYKLVFKSYYL